MDHDVDHADDEADQELKYHHHPTLERSAEQSSRATAGPAAALNALG
jgi:hypothetical protein